METVLSRMGWNYVYKIRNVRQKIMKITANSLILYWQYVCDIKSKSKDYISSLKPLFALNSFGDIAFNPDNYASNDILRYIVDLYDPSEVYLIEQGRLMIPYAGDTHIIYIWNNKTNDMYTVSWYKSRGRTETMQVNGQNMDIQSYINALSTLGIYEWEQIPKGLRYHDEAIAYRRQLSETSSI